MKITIEFEGQDYILEYSRKSVRSMEGMGFELDKLSTHPMTQVPLLFHGGLMMHHRSLKRKEADEIYEQLENRDELLQTLVEMYGETISSLTDTKNEGNATWKVSR